MSSESPGRRPRPAGARLLLSLACLCFFPSESWAARSYHPVGSSSGLEARVAVSMLFDQAGFLWVGSREGLFRYDGYQTVAYLPEPADPESISDGDVRFVYESDDGHIWVGTNTGGLNVLDPDTGVFRHFRHDPSDPGSLPDDSVYGIVEDRDGAIWVATQEGLGKLDRRTGRFEVFRHDPGDPGSLAHDWAYHLHVGPRGDLWISTVGGGVHRWNPGSRNFTRFDLAVLTDGPPNRNDTFTIYEAMDGNVWVGTREGLVVVDPGTTTARHIEFLVDPAYLSVITSSVADDSGRLWLGTMIDGVLIVDLSDGSVASAIDGSPGTPGNLPEQPQMSLAIAGDTLFVGTWGSGVYRTSLEASRFELMDRDALGRTLRNHTISSVLATDEPGRPWLGSFGGGPQRLDVYEARLAAAVEVEDAMYTSGVIDMTQTRDGQLWAATTKGLFSFDDQGLSTGLDAHDPGRPGGLGEGYVYALLEDGAGGLWVGVGGSGLYHRSADSQTYRRYAHDPADPASLSGDFITSLLHGASDSLWVGTRSNGLNHCRTDPWTCESFGAEVLGQAHVTDLHRDRRGRLWVATDGGGVAQVLQDQSGQVTGFQNWSVDNGLLNDGIMAIAEDRDGSLWLSTRHGLSRLDPDSGAVSNHVAASGLQVSHFNTGASDADDDFIYFGSVEGLLVIEKGSPLLTRPPAPVSLTSIEHADRGEQMQPMDWGPEGLSVPYGDVLSLEFAVLDFSETPHDYAYRLGEEDAWINLGPRRQVTFFGLAPGSYQFQVRGRDAFGRWGEAQPLPLDVVPPFWMTTTFRVMIALLALFLAWGLHRLRENEIKRRAREVQRLSEKREQALELALGDEAELAVLTPRQKEVLQLIAEGYSTREVGELLGVSAKTVDNHRAHLMQRLDIHDIPGLVKLAIRTRLVSPHD